MNLTMKQDGLSARRKTLKAFRNIFSNFNLWVVILVIPVLLSSCHERTNGQNPQAKKKSAAIAKDSLNEPNVNIKVNKHYDDKGKVIGFDSTYTSFYSNVQGDTARMDSLMTSFDRYFNRDHSLFFRNQFNSLFFNDSLRYPDFFHNDFFMKRYELNDQYLRNIMNRMDSIKNRFYQLDSTKEKDNSSKDL